MKHIKLFENFINEEINYQSIADNEEFEKEVADILINKLGAKDSKEIIVLDMDENGKSKSYKFIEKTVIDWEEIEELTDYDVYYYSKKYNVCKQDSDGYINYYILLKDIK